MNNMNALKNLLPAANSGTLIYDGAPMPPDILNVRNI